jgi:hypothetical protein
MDELKWQWSHSGKPQKNVSQESQYFERDSIVAPTDYKTLNRALEFYDAKLIEKVRVVLLIKKTKCKVPVWKVEMATLYTSSLVQKPLVEYVSLRTKDKTGAPVWIDQLQGMRAA